VTDKPAAKVSIEVTKLRRFIILLLTDVPVQPALSNIKLEAERNHMNPVLI